MTFYIYYFNRPETEFTKPSLLQLVDNWLYCMLSVLFEVQIVQIINYSQNIEGQLNNIIKQNYLGIKMKTEDNFYRKNNGDENNIKTKLGDNEMQYLPKLDDIQKDQKLKPVDQQRQAIQNNKNEQINLMNEKNSLKSKSSVNLNIKKNKQSVITGSNEAKGQQLSKIKIGSQRDLSKLMKFKNNGQLGVILENKIRNLMKQSKGNNQVQNKSIKRQIRDKETEQFNMQRSKTQTFRFSSYSNFDRPPAQSLTSKQNKKAQLLQKIPDHRRIRNTSKMSQKLLELQYFFKGNHHENQKHKQIDNEGSIQGSRMLEFADESRNTNRSNFGMGLKFRQMRRVHSQCIPADNERMHSRQNQHEKQRKAKQLAHKYKQSEQNLENLLQIKLNLKPMKTQNSDSSYLNPQKPGTHLSTHDLISYRSPSQSGSVLSNNLGFTIGHLQPSRVLSRSPSHSPQMPNSRLTYHINQPKLADILSKPDLNSSKQIVRKNQQFRIQNNLRSQPKQWQFHNCLALQKIQLYSTNLKISCEGWAVIDILELKYIRGWNPKAEDDFSPCIKLFIAKIGYQLGSITKHPYNIDKILIRVNDRHIYATQRDKLTDKHAKVQGIPPHSILNLSKLVTATLITGFGDLVLHSIIAIGFILYQIKNNTAVGQHIDPLKQFYVQGQYHIYIKNSQKSQLSEYCKCFQEECMRICGRLQLANTKLSTSLINIRNYLQKNMGNKSKNGSHSKSHSRDLSPSCPAITLSPSHYMLSSTPLDISLLLTKCLSHIQFKQALSLRKFEPQIRYQVGWNFWQTRCYKWENQQLIKYGIKAIGGRNGRNNQCYAVWDDKRELSVVMADSKVNMHWNDFARVGHWVEKHIDRFSKNYYVNMTFYPTDTQKFHRIN